MGRRKGGGAYQGPGDNVVCGLLQFTEVLGALGVKTLEVQSADSFEDGENHVPPTRVTTEIEISFEVWDDAVGVVRDDLALGGAVRMGMAGEASFPGCICICCETC